MAVVTRSGTSRSGSSQALRGKRTSTFLRSAFGVGHIPFCGSWWPRGEEIPRWRISSLADCRIRPVPNPFNDVHEVTTADDATSQPQSLRRDRHDRPEDGRDVKVGRVVEDKTNVVDQDVDPGSIRTTELLTKLDGCRHPIGNVALW